MSNKVKRVLAGTVIGLAMFIMISPSVSAIEPHQDPEAAEQVFSGISLLRYYSNSLDFVLQKDIIEVEARLNKMPFASIIESLVESVDDFTTSSINISHLILEIDEGLGNLTVLLEQFRLSEAAKQATQIVAGLLQADSELENIEQAVEITGNELKVLLTPDESDLRRAYNELLERIDRIRQMLELYYRLLESTGINIDELLESTETDIEELLESTEVVIEELLASIGITSLNSTDITLTIEPTTTFVGNNINFEGVLTSEGKPMAGREIDILLNNSQYITVKTDANGHYQGILQVPYWYIPQIEVQALYFPRSRDIGHYLSSLSPVIELEVLFHDAKLDIILEDKAYPGLETTIIGRFDYNQSLLFIDRKVEIYFDDVLISEVIARSELVYRMELDSEIDVGKHIVTLSAIPEGRYSPTINSAVLNVTKAIPILDLSIPRIALIPGSIGLEGRLYSDVGPLNEALIKMNLGNSEAEIVTSEDGRFATEIGVGIGFGLIGSQDIDVQVFTQEPWHAPLITTRSLVIANMVNCGSILIILVFLGVYLPRKFQSRLGIFFRRRRKPAVTVTQPEPAPIYSNSAQVTTSPEKSRKISREPKNIIFYWYGFTIKAIQAITNALLKPQQTLREFVNESNKALGPAARYFMAFTRIVERILYSPYRPTEDDVKESEHISNTIKYLTEFSQIVPRLFFSRNRPTDENADKNQRLPHDVTEGLHSENI